MSSIFLGVRIQRQRRRNPFAPETSYGRWICNQDDHSSQFTWTFLVYSSFSAIIINGHSWFILVFLP